MRDLRNLVASGKNLVASGAVLGTVLLSGCQGYNLRMASVTIDRANKPDVMIGWGCLANGGSYKQIGGVNLALDNPHWYSKLTIGYNQHTDTKQDAEKRTTVQMGTLLFCFPEKDEGYLQAGGVCINNGPTCIFPLLDWRHGKK